MEYNTEHKESQLPKGTYFIQFYPYERVQLQNILGDDYSSDHLSFYQYLLENRMLPVFRKSSETVSKELQISGKKIKKIKQDLERNGIITIKRRLGKTDIIILKRLKRIKPEVIHEPKKENFRSQDVICHTVKNISDVTRKIENKEFNPPIKRKVKSVIECKYPCPAEDSTSDRKPVGLKIDPLCKISDTPVEITPTPPLISDPHPPQNLTPNNINKIILIQEEEKKEGNKISGETKNILLERGITEPQINILLLARDEEFIKNKIEQFHYLKKNKAYAIKGDSRYIYKSILDNWQDESFEKYSYKIKMQKEAEMRNSEFLEKLTGDEIDEDYDRYKNITIDLFLSLLPIEKQIEINNEAEKECAKSPFGKKGNLYYDCAFKKNLFSIVGKMTDILSSEEYFETRYFNQNI